MTWTIKAIIDAELACEQCGNRNLKRNVVLERDGQLLYVGTTCASYMLLGSRKSGDKAYIDDLAKWCNVGRKWLANGHDINAVYDGLRKRCGYAMDLQGNVVRFLNRETGQVMATVTQE